MAGMCNSWVLKARFDHVISVNCGDPASPANGSAGNYPHTREGATATFQCDDGFRPSQLMIATCTSTAEWMPLPQSLLCTFVTGQLVARSCVVNYWGSIVLIILCFQLLLTSFLWNVEIMLTVQETS